MDPKLASPGALVCLSFFFLQAFEPALFAHPIPSRNEAANKRAVLDFNKLESAADTSSADGSTVRAQQILNGFLALYDTNDALPADAMGAVGPNHIITTLNTQVRIQRKNREQVRTVSLQQFWSPLGAAHPFDPKIVYDPLEGRWIFTACNDTEFRDSSLLLGISTSDDPTLPWNMYSFPNSDAANYVDYPSLGFNKNRVVIQTMMKKLSDRSFSYSRIYIFNKQEFYAGQEGTVRILERGDIDMVQSPAVTLDPNVEINYLVGTTTLSASDHQGITLYAITGDSGAETLSVVKEFTIADPWNAQPPGLGNFAPQLGSSQNIHLQPSWINNVVYRQGSLWTTHVIFVPNRAPTRSSIQWFQLTPESVLQHGRIDDPTGRYFYGYSSIAINRQNDALIGFSRFSSEDYPGAYYAVRSATDPSGTFRSDQLLKTGEGVYYKTRGQGKNRWGDYSATVVDPSDDLTFWTIQEYSAQPEGDPSQDGSGRWSTWWGKIAPPSPAPGFVYIIPTKSSVRLGVRIPVGMNAILEKTRGLEPGSWQFVEQLAGSENLIEREFAFDEPVQFFRLRN